MSELVVSDQNFETEVLKHVGQPVLVDFWAVWCYPCKLQAPILEEVDKELSGKVKITKVEVDESPNTAGKFNILSIPTLAIFKDGNLVWQGVGVHQKSVILAELNKHLT